MNSQPTPYATAADHWAEERDRLIVRLQRLAAERHPQRDQDHRYIAYLREREAALREAIDARLGATRAMGSQVPLDQLVGRLDLAHVERCVLIVLVVMTLLGPDGRQLLNQVEGSRYGGRLTSGLVFVVLGLDLDARADLIERLGRDRELIRSGLVTLGWDPETPADIMESTVALTHQGLGVLMGREPMTKITGDG